MFFSTFINFAEVILPTSSVPISEQEGLETAAAASTVVDQMENATVSVQEETSPTTPSLSSQEMVGLETQEEDAESECESEDEENGDSTVESLEEGAQWQPTNNLEAPRFLPSTFYTPDLTQSLPFHMQEPTFQLAQVPTNYPIGASQPFAQISESLRGDLQSLNQDEYSPSGEENSKEEEYSDEEENGESEYDSFENPLYPEESTDYLEVPNFIPSTFRTPGFNPYLPFYNPGPTFQLVQVPINPYLQANHPPTVIPGTLPGAWSPKVEQIAISTQKVTWDVEKNTICYDLKASCLCGNVNCELKFGTISKFAVSDSYIKEFYSSEEEKQAMLESQREEQKIVEENRRELIAQLEEDSKTWEQDVADVDDAEEEPAVEVAAPSLTDPLSLKVQPVKKRIEKLPMTLYSGIPFKKMTLNQLKKSEKELNVIFKHAEEFAYYEWLAVYRAEVLFGAARGPGSIHHWKKQHAEEADQRMRHAEDMLNQVRTLIDEQNPTP